MKGENKMKKIFALAVAMICAIAFMCFTVNGESTDFSVDVIADEYVNAGETVTVTVKVHEIKSGVSMNAVSFEVEYDEAMFEYVSGECTTTLADWSLPEPTCVGNILEFNLADDSSNVSSGIGSTKSITYALKFKVKTDSSDSGKISVTFASGMSFSGGVSNHSGKLGEKSFTLIKQLSTPTNPVLSSAGAASWDAVPNATSYKLQLYKDGEKLGGEVSSNTNSYDFSSAFAANLGGIYSFEVSAVSTSDAYGASDAATSADVKHRGKLITPTLTVNADKITGKVEFTISDSNPDETVSIYLITVYSKDGSMLKEHETTSLSGSIEGLTIGTEYKFTVQAMALPSESDDAAGNDSSAESAEKALTVDGIVGISVTKKPGLSYTEGDALNLSSMEITVKYAVSKSEVIKKDKFSSYGIKVTPAHGADLTVSMNGSKISVTCGSLSASEELVLEIKAGLCAHERTEPEHKDPSCSEDGYDSIVCSLCGVAVEITVIPSLEHTFGAWSWLSTPTTSMDGVRKRTCSQCGDYETEPVTYAEYLAMISQSGSAGGSDSQPNATTTPEATTPEETDPKRRNDALGGLGDIGKIFLYALIAILFIIVLFVVLAVWLESRRNRRRKSRARTSQARNAQMRNSYNRTSQQGRSPRAGNQQHMRNGNGQRRR